MALAMHHRPTWLQTCLVLVTASTLFGCGDDTSPTTTGTSTTTGGACDASALVFETGSSTGNADPFGAKAAGQARAGAIKAADVPPPKHGRQGYEDGDFVLANDKIAVFIENKDVSDGYGRFGGEIIGIDRVGADGKPLGESMFLETLQLTSLYMVNPTSVTVLKDGSDGGEAVVRATGPLEPLPFLEETFGGAFPTQYAGLTAAYDYVLEPGAEKLTVRFGFINSTDYAVDTGLNFDGSWELLGFFQSSQNNRFNEIQGFDKPTGFTDFVAYENEGINFAYMAPEGEQLEFGGIDISGFQVFAGTGMQVEACSMDLKDRHEIVVGPANGKLDDLIETVHRVRGEPAWRRVTGTVTDGDGQPVEGARVHVIGKEGYLNRVTTDLDGNYSVQAPPNEDVTLVPQKAGYPKNAGTAVPVATTTKDLSFAPNGFIHVTATELASSDAIPVRIQVIPTVPEAATPATYGFEDQANGRLWQQFSPSGEATLAVPPGEHRVVVSHGYEYEMADQTVTVGAGETLDLPVVLEHSVASENALSADFHIHSMYSADSQDPVEYKARGVLADGIELPFSSEHEWIISFQPYFEQFGATKWAQSFSSEELTTFAWGHFGVIPALPTKGALNNGAVDWLGHSAKEVFEMVHQRPENPALIVNHPSGDSAFQAYFTSVNLDYQTGTSTSTNWDENFDAIEVCNDSDFESNRDRSIKHWFALLNAGKTFWAVGSSDSHKLLTNPAGYPRTYLFFGKDDPAAATMNDARDAVKSGHATISGGMFMNVQGPGGSGPGDIVPGTGTTADFTVTVETPSWIQGDTLEVIVNGETVKTEALAPIGTGTGHVYVNDVTVTVPSGPRAWVVFAAKGMGDLAPLHPGRKPFALSNPVMFEQ